MIQRQKDSARRRCAEYVVQSAHTLIANRPTSGRDQMRAACVCSRRVYCGACTMYTLDVSRRRDLESMAPATITHGCSINGSHRRRLRKPVHIHRPCRAIQPAQTHHTHSLPAKSFDLMMVISNCTMRRSPLTSFWPFICVALAICLAVLAGTGRAASASKKTPAQLQARLLIRLHQIFEMFHRLASVCNQQLRNLRNRNEHAFLQVVRDIRGQTIDYGEHIEKRFEKLAHEFSTSVERIVNERQKSSNGLTIAFEKQVETCLPHSRNSEESLSTVAEIRTLWKKSNEHLNDVMAKSRAEVRAATAAATARGRKLQESGDMQRKLERLAAELVMELHKITDRNLQDGVGVVQKFELVYTDMVKKLLTLEKVAHTKKLQMEE